MIIPGTRTWQVKQAAGWRDWARASGPLGMLVSSMIPSRTAPQTTPTTAQPAAPKPAAPKPATPTPQPVSSWHNAPGGGSGPLADRFPRPQRQRSWWDDRRQPGPWQNEIIGPRNHLIPRSQQQHQYHNPYKTNTATAQPSSPYEFTPRRRLRDINFDVKYGE